MKKNPLQHLIQFVITINDYNTYLLNVIIIYVHELQTIFFIAFKISLTHLFYRFL